MHVCVCAHARMPKVQKEERKKSRILDPHIPPPPPLPPTEVLIIHPARTLSAPRSADINAAVDSSALRLTVRASDCSLEIT